jgi:uncharacterized protein YfbU (UPF0304 family)
MGFDGNNEARQMGYAAFYCSSGGGRFGWLGRPTDFNSHAPSLERYRQIVRRWKQTDESNHLTLEQIIGIISD